MPPARRIWTNPWRRLRVKGKRTLANQRRVSRAILSQAILSRAILSRAILSRAILSRAILSRAILSRAILSRAMRSPCPAPGSGRGSGWTRGCLRLPC